MTRKRGEMSKEFLCKILNEAYGSGIREVGFYTTGEPLLAKNLVFAIKLAKEIGYEYVYITSNGALATMDRIVPVIEAGLDSLKFSINAGDRESYKFVHGVDDFDKVINNLKKIHEYRKQNNLSFNIYVSFVITRFTMSQVDKFKDEVGKYCDEIVFINVANQGGLNSEISEYLSVSDNDLSIKSSCKDLPCSLPFNSVTVSYEGFLTSCCVDFQNYLVIADLNKVSLQEAWHSESFQKFRKKHLEKNVEGSICHNCVTNARSCFSPLNPEFATLIDFEKIYDDNDVKSRIEKYLEAKK